MESVRKMRQNNGQSMFEVVVAVGMSAIVLIAVASLAAGSVRNSSYTSNNSQATKYAQEQIEWLRGQRDADWSAFIGNIDSGGCNGALSWGGSCTISSTFTRSVSFTCYFRNLSTDIINPVLCSSGYQNINVVDATVVVSWTDAQGVHEVRSSTRLSDWRDR